jgi:plastocyanin
MAADKSIWRGARWVAIGFAVATMALALAGLHSELAASAGPTAQLSATKTVDINHFAYSPTPLTIATGTTVTFTNSSKVTHTATRAGAFNTGHIHPGTSISIRFNHAGSFSYHCLIHARMHGKIVVR